MNKEIRRFEMKVYDLLKNRPIFEKLKKKYPAFTEYSKKVEVVEWKEEFEEFNANPEIVDAIEFLNMLLQNNLISKEEYEQHLKNLKFFASKTLGVAFKDEDKVAFRGRPSDETIIHELGHCFFKAHDLVWSSIYGGGESLFWLGLRRDDIRITEQSIFFYHSLLERALKGDTETVNQIIVDKLSRLSLDTLPHIISYVLYAGYILEPNCLEPNFIDHKDENILNFKLQALHVQDFFVNCIIGTTQYDDPLFIAYTKAIFENS